MSLDPSRLASRLAVEFRRPELLARALTHRSADSANNERLEFLGDAVLGLVIGEALWRRFPDANEGQLSRLRATLVCKETLAGVARELDLGAYLRLGGGELRTGGHARDSILSDGLEAVLGAAYLDQGFAGAEALILRLFDRRLAESDIARAAKDAKTRLQERLQARHRPLPHYEVVSVEGDEHAQRFQVRCTLADEALSAVGSGKSRRRAEQQAAVKMLERLEAHG